MVDLTREEFQILWLVEEGNGIPEGIVSFLEYSLTDVRDTFRMLEKYGLIQIKKQEDFWEAKTTDKARELYAQYERWIP